MKTITFEIGLDALFDDIIAFDCVIEVMRERINDSSDYQDQATMRRWLKTLYKYNGLLERAHDE